MKKIKRTIIMRKVEVVRHGSVPQHSGPEICPLCHSAIPQIPPTDSAVIDLSTAESPRLLADAKKIEIEGEKND